MYNMIPARRSFDSLFNMLDAFDQNTAAMMRTDILDTGDTLELQAELPGFTKDEIELEIENGILTISASRKEETEVPSESEAKPGRRYLCRERRQTSYKRSFQLEGIREDNITADFENGILTLTMPKEETKVCRRIALN